ncbi:MAG: ZIP family metal transporter [Proteobacteria bacterium]|nr:ZIP family metal transporter [Pseudomonadota bacterium]
MVVGIYLVLSKEEWALRNTVLFLSFAAGVILAVVFTHILPEAVELYPSAFHVALFTIIAFYILEHTIGIHTCREGECNLHSKGLLAFTGITTHSLIDGVVIGIGFEADFKIGLASTVAILLHKLPVGISITAIFLHSGFGRKKTVVRAWIVALATPVGALVSYFLIQSVDEALLGLLLAFSAGALIYVGASDLLPETHKTFKKSNIVLVLLGVSLVYFVSIFVGGH